MRDGEWIVRETSDGEIIAMRAGTMVIVNFLICVLFLMIIGGSIWLATKTYHTPEEWAEKVCEKENLSTSYYRYTRT